MSGYDVLRTLNQAQHRATALTGGRWSNNLWQRLPILPRFIASTLTSLALAVGAGKFAYERRPILSTQVPTPGSASNNIPASVATPTPQPTLAITSTPIPTATLTSYLASITPTADTSSTSPSAALPLSPPKFITYIVQPGDYVSLLAERFGQEQARLEESNPPIKANPSLIHPGDILFIPHAPGFVIQAMSGDTVKTLAQRQNLLPEFLLAEPSNQLTRSDQPLTAGQPLFVPIPFNDLPSIARPAAGGGVWQQTEDIAPANASVTDITPTFAFPTQAHWLSGNDFSPEHPGVDFYGTLGTPVYAAADGIVIYSGYDLNANGAVQGFGLYVVVNHNNGYRSLYGHLSQASVSSGGVLQRGQLLGLIGNTGNTTGPHLHFELRNMGMPVNPWGVLQ